MSPTRNGLPWPRYAERTSRTDEERDDEEQVDEPHEQVVDLSAVVAGDRSHDRAQDGREHATKNATQSDVRSPKMTRLR